jgi:hypothetical protein
VSCCLSDCHCSSLMLYLAFLKHVNDLIAGGSEGSGRKATDWSCFANLWDANGPAFASTIVLHICGPPRRVPGNMPSTCFCCILHSPFWRGSFQICHLPLSCYSEVAIQNVSTSSHGLWISLVPYRLFCRVRSNIILLDLIPSYHLCSLQWRNWAYLWQTQLVTTYW